MANALYDKGREALISGQTDLFTALVVEHSLSAYISENSAINLQLSEYSATNLQLSEHSSTNIVQNDQLDVSIKDIKQLESESQHGVKNIVWLSTTFKP